MKRRTPEEIVALLREAESGTESILDFCRRKGIAAGFWQVSAGYRVYLPVVIK